jgi:hypothetical protein
MENRLAAVPIEGEEPRPATQVVADVLNEKCKNNTLLQNAGIVSGKPRSSSKSVQARLEVEIRANGDLRSVVSSQHVEIEVLSRQLQEMEQARLRDKEDMEKKHAALEAKLERLLGQA